MKLRNKNTGEIGVLEATTYHGGRPDNIVGVYEMGMGAVRVLAQYNTLEELLKEWEDYKPAEPLIKDEKIRKAVRAWADANGLDDLSIYYDANYHRFCDDPDFSITIRFYREVDGDLHSGYSYRLDELCGEEEEE